MNDGTGIIRPPLNAVLCMLDKYRLVRRAALGGTVPTVGLRHKKA